ncbi:AMP-binding protein [uncultured Roseibium sp.]|uniref:AMP-binding protein n=1 Tax=uncultured Roseibium sp. TaxID=1936171 RepID=UPI0032168187
MQKIATIEDIERVEAAGLETFLPEKTPYDLIRAARDRNPNAVAIRFLKNAGKPEDDLLVTYDQLVKRIHQAARAFRRLGVGPDDSVAILVPNTPCAQIALWGAQLAGRACPINPMLKPDHIAGLLKASGAKVVVVLGDNDEAPVWRSVVPGLQSAGVDIPILECEGDRPSKGAYGRFEALCEVEDDSPFAMDGDEHAVSAFYHTGGTTGAPKLVRHTRLNEAHVGRSCALMYDLQPSDRTVNGFPLFHVAGAFVYGLSTLCAGAELIIPGRLGMRISAFVSTIWSQVEHYGITAIGGVPTVISALNGIPVDADISSLRLMLTGGSPLPPELADAFEARTAKPVRNILGMTESAGCIAVEPFHGPRTPGSCGLRLPFTKVCAIAQDTETPTPLENGTHGILAVRGVNVSPGYTDASVGRDTFPGDGWLVSGDIGLVDENSRIFITGRAKDVIIRGAHNLDPQSIEDAFLSHPSVANAAAVGMPDSYAGELPVVFVQLRSGADIDIAELQDHAVRTIPEPAAVPKRIEIVDEIPLTPVGKIFKPALRRLATRWSLQAAARHAGFELPDDRLDVDEKLACRVVLDPDQAAKLREATTGMAIKLVIEDR